MNDIKDKLFAQERKGQIFAMIQKNERMTVANLASEFQVTPATVRTDLQELEDMQLIIRTHGGAMLRPERNIKEMLPNAKETLYHNEKENIAKAALKYINDGDTIALDAGTTIIELAKLLHLKEDLTVITNDLQIALVLESHQHIKTHLLGGIVRHHFHYTIDSSTLNTLGTFAVNKTFISCNAIDIEFGLSTPDVHLAALKQKMMQISEQSLLLCDSSKIGKKAFKSFSSITDIDTVITDDKINPKMLNSLEELGANIIIASPLS